MYSLVTEDAGARTIGWPDTVFLVCRGVLGGSRRFIPRAATDTTEED
jgi:hypothetical protein